MSTHSVESYDTFLSTFRMEVLTSQFAGNLQTGLNVCYECCDRYAGTNKPALFWESKDGRSATYTFDELQALSAQFANFLHEQGIGPGDRVAALLPRIPELFVVALGTWRAGAVYQTLFTAFGPKAIEYRLERSGASLVVTDSANRSKLEGISSLPPVMTVVGESSNALEGDLNFGMRSTGNRTRLSQSCAQPTILSCCCLPLVPLDWPRALQCH
jgi:acetyl-CoA synthetase